MPNIYSSRMYRAGFVRGSVLCFALMACSYGIAAEASTTAPSPAKRELRAQETVTGVVKNLNTGEPISGVTVKVKGKESAAQTDESGNFTVNAVVGDVLQVSFIGFKTQEVPVSTAAMTVNLAPNEEEIDAVVVVGYGTQKLKEVTSSVAHVDAEQFRQSGARNPLDLIQGKVAGLQVSRSGSNPNSGVATQIRGAISVTGSASPLYVIDGIPGGNPDLLQQDDIESIDVLKDGSGAAIYGTSANAGVILITTKKGTPGQPQVNYSSYFRKDFLFNRPDFLTADQFRQKIDEGAINREDRGHSTDFFDDLVNHDNFSHNHNISLSGGSESTTYRGSVNYRNLQGIAKENGREEYTVRMNLNQKAFDNKVNFQLNMATNTNHANMLGGGGWESEATKNPTFSNFNDDGSYYYDFTSTNEFARLSTETSYRKQQTSSIDGKVDVDIIEGLRFSAFGSVQRNSYVDGSYRQLNSEASLEDQDYPGGGYASKANLLNQKYAFEPTLTYNKTFADVHSLTALAGYSYRYEMDEGQSADNRGFINDRFNEDNLSEGQALRDGRANLDSYKNDNTLIAFFGRVNYAFNNKYMIQAIVRREGSSKFGANNKWGTFPSLSAGWNISSEEFMQDVAWVNFLKLRVGYGVTGNTGFANNASRLTLGGGGKYLYPDQAYRETYGPDRNPNPDLRWETKKETNIGVDFTLFDNKLSGAIDVFQRKTVDLLDIYRTPQPPYIRENIYSNVGTMSSKGIELALSYRVMDKGDFKWSMDATASTLKNVMESYSNDVFTVKYKTFGSIGGAGDLGDAYTTFEGQQIGQFFGKKFAGFDDDGKWLFYNRNGEAVRNDVINNSRDDLNSSDLQHLGNAVPKYYVSWTNNFTYKNFDLRIFMRGKFDYDILNTTALSYGNKVWTGNLLQDAFTKYDEINDTYMYSDYYLESGSHFKIDELTLGYRFNLNNSRYFKNLRLYVTGQNLLTITGYSGNDPDFVLDTGLGNEINGQRLGIDSRGPYPNTRSFLFGVNFGF